MKKFTRVMAFVLTMALVLCSFVMPATAATTESKWAMGGGSTLVSESSEYWIVDTVTVQLAPAGRVQHTEKLTDLIGADGKDGKGFVNVVIEDGSPEKTNSHSYVFMQFLGSDQVTEDIPRDGATDKGITWYIAGHDTTSGRIDNHNGRVALDYGKYTDFSSAGYKMAFTEKEDGKVYVRAIGTGAYTDATNYDSSKVAAVASAQTLASIQGEDGVYLRFREYVDTGVKLTITVAYPMPADYDYDANHWTVTAGSEVLDNSIETWSVDTATVSMPGVNGYFQHKEKMTELVGSNGQEGKGFVNVLVEDGTVPMNRDNGYFKLMLTGKSDPTQTIDRGTGTDKAVIWAFRGDGKRDTSLDSGQIANAAQNSATAYGKHEDIVAAGGYWVTFSRNADNKAMIRGFGSGAYSDALQFAKNKLSDKALTDLAGDNGATAADGVYLRIHTGCSSVALKVTTTVAYPCEAPVEEKPTEPAGLTLSVEKLTFTEGEDIVINFENYNVAADHDVEIRLVKGHGRTDAEMKALEYRYDYTDLSDNYSSGTQQDTSMAITESGTRAFPTDGYAGTAVVAGKYSIAAYDYNDGAKQVSNLIEITVVEASAEPSETPSATPGQTPNQPTGDSSIALAIVAMVLCAGAVVVMAKKRGCAK